MGKLASGLRAHDQDGTGSVAHDALGHAAEQRTAHAGAPVAGYDNEISGPFLGRFDNRRGGRAGLHKLQRRGWQSQPRMEPALVHPYEFEKQTALQSRYKDRGR